MQSGNSFFIIICSICLLLFSCERDNRGVLKNSNGENFTIEQENIIGEQISSAIQLNAAVFPIVDENEYPLAYSYLRDSVLRGLLFAPTISRRRNLNTNVFITKKKEREHIFFLPNGDLYVDLGLLKFLENDSELWGVIYHELAYLEENYILENLKERFSSGVLNELADGEEPTELSAIALYFSTIEYSREQNLFADEFALMSVCDYQYDPLGMKIVMERADERNDWIDWFNLKQAAVKIRKEKIDDVLYENRENCLKDNIKNRTLEYTRFKNQYLPQ